MILRLGTHVMVLDLQLQDGSGMHVCRQVRAADPSIQGILVTSADDDDALAAAVLAGAAGFVVKLARSSDVMGAIRKLGAGRALTDSDLIDRAGHGLRARAQALVPALSDREFSMLDQVLAGHTDREIAHHLGQELPAAHLVVAGLVDRLMAPGWVTAHAADGNPTGGKHRRSM